MNRPRIIPRRTADGMADSRRKSERGGRSGSATSAHGLDMISVAADELSPTRQAAATQDRPLVGHAHRNGAPNKSPPGHQGPPQRVERPLRPAGVGASIDRVAFRGLSHAESVNTKQQALPLDMANPRKRGSVPKKTSALDDDGASGSFSRKDETVDAILQIMKRFVHPASQNKSVHLKLYTIAQIVESRMSRAGDHSSLTCSGPALQQSVKAIVSQIYEAVSSRPSGGSPGQKRRRTDESSQDSAVRTMPVPRSLDKVGGKPKRIRSCLIDIDSRLDKSSPIRLHPATEMANIRRVLPPHSGRAILRGAATSLSPPASPEPVSLAAGHERVHLLAPIASDGVSGDILSDVLEPGKCLNGLPTSFHAEAVRNARGQETAGAVASCSRVGQLGVCAERLQGALAQSARTSLGVMASQDLGDRLDAGGVGPPKQPPRGDREKSGQVPMHPSQPEMPPLPPPQRRSFVPRFA